MSDLGYQTPGYFEFLYTSDKNVIYEVHRFPSRHGQLLVTARTGHWWLIADDFGDLVSGRFPS